MSETTDELDKLLHIQMNPWLYDNNLTDEEKIVYKLKGQCHVCGIDPAYHRDDCEYSATQLMMASLQSGLFSLDFYTMQIRKKYIPTAE